MKPRLTALTRLATVGLLVCVISMEPGHGQGRPEQTGQVPVAGSQAGVTQTQTKPDPKKTPQKKTDQEKAEQKKASQQKKAAKKAEREKAKQASTAPAGPGRSLAFDVRPRDYQTTTRYVLEITHPSGELSTHDLKKPSLVKRTIMVPLPDLKAGKYKMIVIAERPGGAIRSQPLSVQIG